MQIESEIKMYTEERQANQNNRQNILLSFMLYTKTNTFRDDGFCQ